MKNTLKNIIQSLRKIETRWITIFLPVLLLGIFFFCMTLNNVFTETYDLDRFNKSKETIRSPITIENEEETNRKTQETYQSVEDRYTIQDEITEEQISYVNEIFDAVTNMEEEQEKEKNDDKLSNQEKVQHLKQILSEDITEVVNDGILFELIDIPEKEREAGEALFIPSVKDAMEKGVRQENKESALTEVKQKIQYSSLSDQMKDVLNDLNDFAVIENSFFDLEKTNEARKEAANNVEPVIIRAGDVIVREGQTITNDIYENLKLVGLLNKERNIYPIVGLGLFILLIIGFIAYEMNILKKDHKLDKGKIISIISVSILVVSLMKIVSLFTTQINHLFYVVPAATGVLLIKQIINERLAIVFASIFALMGCIIFNGEIPGSLNVEAGIYFFFSQVAGIILLMNVKDRLTIVRTGLGMAVINCVIVVLFLFLSFEKFSMSVLFTESSLAVAAALLSAILTIGLLPFLETGLGILSDMKLLSLSNPNQPLLRKILTEAPGTYHHSIMVANLSETACEAIGANGLLARVGAYYHDLGKTLRPHYFIENQVSIRNPHDTIEPKESADIIISHPYDGARMLKEHHLPKEIIDIALEHHGTTLLKYFYYKAKENDENQDIEENDYRYPGPKPQTKESAIVSICDSVEAAVRSLKEPTEEKIEEIVSSIINDRMMDGQLNESPLTLKELEKIHTAVCETLKGIFHSRIQYPMKEAT
ncbi:MAG TPA: HDIG domain-containing protein [Virgibacillus sp.]|nr:HDIG domain-containing protein [Virgibacillus sp.]